MAIAPVVSPTHIVRPTALQFTTVVSFGQMMDDATPHTSIVPAANGRMRVMSCGRPSHTSFKYSQQLDDVLTSGHCQLVASRMTNHIPSAHHSASVSPKPMPTHMRCSTNP